jgi:hypothetical protein
MDLKYSVTTNPDTLTLTLELVEGDDGVQIKVADIADFTVTLTNESDWTDYLTAEVIKAAAQGVVDKAPGYFRDLVVGKTKKIADEIGLDFDAEGEKVKLVATGLKFASYEDSLLITGEVDVK